MRRGIREFELKVMMTAPLEDIRALSEEDKTRIATALDTDGTISHKGSGTRCYPVFELKGNTMLPIWLYKRFRGGIFGPYRSKKRKTIGTIGECGWTYVWGVKREDELENFLTAIRDYVWLKQPQVDIAIEMLRIKRQKEGDYGARLDELAEEMTCITERQKNPYLPDIRTGELDLSHIEIGEKYWMDNRYYEIGWEEFRRKMHRSKKK